MQKESNNYNIEKNIHKKIVNFSNKIYSSKNMIRRGLSLLIIVLIITLIVSAPYLSHIPNNMYFTEQASSESAEAIPYHISNVTDMYNLDFSSEYHLLNLYARKNGEYILDMPIANPNQDSITHTHPTVSSSSSKNFSVSIISSSNPVDAGQNVTFYSMVKGGVAPFTYSWYGGGNYHTANETSVFYSPGNYSVEVVVTGANGLEASANYTENVLYDYTVFFNSHNIGSFVSLYSQQITINPSFVKSNNYLNITGNFRSNQSINLYFFMPSHVPINVILDHPIYITTGIISAVISLAGLMYIMRKIKI